MIKNLIKNPIVRKIITLTAIGITLYFVWRQYKKYTNRITNLENDKSVILRINDRGPYVDGRILDCSYGAALKLDFVVKGTTKVKVEVIEFGDGKYMHHK